MSTVSITIPSRVMFTRTETYDIQDAAEERGITIAQLVHDAVMNDLAR